MILDQFDLPIIRFITSVVGQSAFFDHLVYALAWFDTFKGVAVMSLLWAAWFYTPARDTEEQKTARQRKLLITFAGSIGIVIFSRILQLALDVHQRPILAGLNVKFPAVVDVATVNTWNSFPSDHAMLFCALATGLWQVNRMIGGVAFFWAIVMVSLPRIYLGYHYPSDVIAGGLFGILLMLGFEKLPLQNAATRVQLWSKRHSATFFCCAFLATEQLAHLFDDVRGIAHLFLGHL